MNGYVFISYSSKNVYFVEKLVATFQKNGIEYWKAPESIPAGTNYAKEIPKAIDGCMAVVLLVSEYSQNSIWVEKEVDAAVCARKIIIPVQIDDNPLNDMYKFYLNNVQMVTYSTEPTSIIEQTISRILAIENIDKKKSTKGSNTLSREEKSNALRINRIPVKCTVCECGLEQISLGVYRCNTCKKEYYDDFQKIRDYLEKSGAAPAIVISRATGVPLKTINYFFQEEYLEIPRLDSTRIVCQQCGAPIRTGTLCERCKKLAGSGNKGGQKSERWKK